MWLANSGHRSRDTDSLQQKSCSARTLTTKAAKASHGQDTHSRGVGVHDIWIEFLTINFMHYTKQSLPLATCYENASATKMHQSGFSPPALLHLLVL